MNIGIFKTLSVTAVAAGLLLGGIRASQAQINFTYTASTVLADPTGGVTGLVLSVDPAADATGDNALSPGTDIRVGDFFQSANTLGSTQVAFSSDFTTTINVTNQLPFATGETAGNGTFVMTGHLNFNVSNTQTSGTHYSIVSGNPQTVTIGGIAYTISDLFGDAIHPPATPANISTFSIHITAPPGVNTPEPGAIAMMVGMGVSGSAFLMRRRRLAK